MLTRDKRTIYCNALIIPQSSFIDPRITIFVAKLPVDIKSTNSPIVSVVAWIEAAKFWSPSPNYAGIFTLILVLPSSSEF